MTYEKPEVRDFGSIADNTYFTGLMNYVGGSGHVHHHDHDGHHHSG